MIKMRCNHGEKQTIYTGGFAAKGQAPPSPKFPIPRLTPQLKFSKKLYIHLKSKLRV